VAVVFTSGCSSRSNASQEAKKVSEGVETLKFYKNRTEELEKTLNKSIELNNALLVYFTKFNSLDDTLDKNNGKIRRLYAELLQAKVLEKKQNK